MVTFDLQVFSVGALCAAWANVYDTAINQFLQFFGREPASFAAQVCTLIDFSYLLPA